MFRFSPRANLAHRLRWREWGQEAFREAADQGKPLAIFLTAFWCGFCQRMDEGALSHPEVIALLNAFFVPVRVEESQRPDVDLRYNQDGWPTIAFLTPDGDHLFSVNYMDPAPFVEVLVRVVQLHQRGDLTSNDGAPAASAGNSSDYGSQPLSPAVFYETVGLLEGLADPLNGGFGDGFKYPHTEANDFFLYLYEVTGQRQYLDHVLLTLDRMRASDTFDSSLGGFFRYSSKPDWNEPHREKLLYDQAGLLRNYLRAYHLTGDNACRETAEGLIKFVETHLFNPALGAFLGCQDYVTVDGPLVPGSPNALAPPVVDEFVYCDANAAMVSAYLDAWRVLGREDCRQRAEQALNVLWRKMRAEDGRMFHYWDGEPDHEARTPGLLMDEVETGLACLDAYALIGDDAHLHGAVQMARIIVERHRLPNGSLADISEPGPGSLSSPVAVLGQNARAAVLFLRLSSVAGYENYREAARKAMDTFPNSHRGHGAFAAGFGLAVGRLLVEPTPARSIGV